MQIKNGNNQKNDKKSENKKKYLNKRIIFSSLTLHEE